MQRIIAIAAFLFFIQSAAAQKSFEGKVTYRISGDIKDVNAEADVYFKNCKIKIIVRDTDANKNGKDDLLVYLDSGITYHINSKSKYFVIENMQKQSPLFPSTIKVSEKNKTILDQPASAYSPGDGIQMGGLKVTFWYADSLFFSCNKKYAANENIVTLTNGNTVCLASEFSLERGAAQTNNTITAISIQQQELPDSIFLVPKDFLSADIITEEKDTVYTAADSITPESMVATDSAIKTTANKKTLKKKSATKASKRNPQNELLKPTATKPKE